MKALSAFDVIGPCMIGPSSSHTAGALALAAMARRIAKCDIKQARFTLYGSFAQTYKGHGTDRALIAGILGFGADDARIRDSFSHARSMGIICEIETQSSEQGMHPNTVDIDITDSCGGKVSMRGVSTGGGKAEIHRMNGIDVKITGERSTLVVCQRDLPGVVSHIAGTLSDEGVNIAFLRVFRRERGEEAYAVIEVDEDVTEATVSRIEMHPHILSAVLVKREHGNGV